MLFFCFCLSLSSVFFLSYNQKQQLSFLLFVLRLKEVQQTHHFFFVSSLRKARAARGTTVLVFFPFLFYTLFFHVAFLWSSLSLFLSLFQTISFSFFYLFLSLFSLLIIFLTHNFCLEYKMQASNHLWECLFSVPLLHLFLSFFLSFFEHILLFINFSFPFWLEQMIT